MAVFHFNQNSITTTQNESLSYYFDLEANLGLFKQLSLIPKCKIKFASKRIPKCIQLFPKKTKDIKTHKGLKNNQKLEEEKKTKAVG